MLEITPRLNPASRDYYKQVNLVYPADSEFAGFANVIKMENEGL